MATLERLGEMMKLWYFNLNDVWVSAGYSTFPLVHDLHAHLICALALNVIIMKKIKIIHIIYILLKLKIIIKIKIIIKKLKYINKLIINYIIFYIWDYQSKLFY